MESEPNNRQEGVDAKCGNDGPSSSMQVKPDDFKQDARLDSTLEEAARRRNLSTLNVKSIIHVRSLICICICICGVKWQERPMFVYSLASQTPLISKER